MLVAVRLCHPSLIAAASSTGSTQISVPIRSQKNRSINSAAAHDLVDLHEQVVHHRQLIGPEAVAAPEHEVAARELTRGLANLFQMVGRQPAEPLTYGRGCG